MACDVCQVPGSCTYATVKAAVEDPGGPNTIRVCAGTYEGDATIAITRTLAIIGVGDGEGEGNTVLRQTGSGGVIDVAAGVQVRLQGLRITGGSNVSIGGGIHHHGMNLTMTGCTLTGNSSNAFGAGLGIARSSVALLTGCTVHLNTAASRAGGIYNLGTLTLTDCEITSNSASVGGGISNGDRDFSNPGFPTMIPGDLTLDNTIVSNNSAESGAGIFNDTGTVRLRNGSQVSDNPATFFGGGISNLATLIIDDSTAGGNTANDQGGGIHNQQGGTATLQNGSRITGNTAGGSDGGGGIYNDSSSLTLDDSRVTGNLGGGGIVNTNGGTVTLQNSSNVSENIGGNCIGPNGYDPALPNDFCAP